MLRQKRNALEVMILERRIQFLKETDSYLVDTMELEKLPPIHSQLKDVSSRQLLINELEKIDQ